MLRKKITHFFPRFSGGYQWHGLFLLIALFGVTAVAISIFLSQQNRKRFTELTLIKKEILSIREVLNRYNTQALRLEAHYYFSQPKPKQDANAESIDDGLKILATDLKILATDLKILRDKFSTTTEISNGISAAQVKDINTALDEITLATQKIAVVFHQQPSYEGNLALDRLALKINENLEVLRKILTKLELDDLNSYDQHAAEMARVEKALGLLLIALLLVATAIGLIKSLRLEGRVASIFSHTSNLEITNQHLEYVLDGAGLGAWDWWLEDNRVKFDRRWMNMIGLEYQEGMDSLAIWDSRVHPDDKANAYAAIKAHLEGKTEVYENVHRMRHANGSWVWILDRGKISEWDGDGKPKRFTGTHFDITHYKEQEFLSAEIQKIANIGAWELDVTTMETKWSEQTYKIHEIPPGEPTNKQRGIEFYAAHDRARIAKFVDECIKGKSFREIFEFIDAKGKKKWVESMGEPVRDAEGKIHKIRGTFQDVSQQISAALKLKLEEERFRQLVLNSPGMVYEFKLETDGRMHFPYASPKALDIYEIEPEDFNNNPSIMLDLAAPDGKDELFKKIQESAQNLTPFEWQGQIITKNGKRKWVTARSTPIKNPDDSILWHGIVIDISKQVAIEQELEFERVKAVHASKLASLGEVSAGIAHEINNPLTVVAGTLPLLKKYINDPMAFDKKIESMQRGCERISKIVQGLKKFSRANHAREMKYEKLRKIFDEVQVLTHAKVSQNSTKIDFKVHGDLDILCDEIEIEQVFVNLINNACDAVSEVDKRWIKVEAKVDGSTVVVQISDSGPGISPEARTRIFQPFFTTKPVGKGTGLGLSISKGILDSHQAEFALNLDSPNTCFEIRFSKCLVNSSALSALAP